MDPDMRDKIAEIHTDLKWVKALLPPLVARVDQLETFRWWLAGGLGAIVAIAEFLRRS